MALESTSVPLERIRIVVNDSVEDVRRTIAQNTSAYSSVLQGLKVGIAADPNLPFVGKVTDALITITINSSMRNSGRPFLRAKLESDNGQTIIKGWLGLHTLVVVFVGVMLLVALDIRSARPWWFILFMLILVGGGYLYERRKLLGALSTCLSTESKVGSGRKVSEKEPAQENRIQ